MIINIIYLIILFIIEIAQFIVDKKIVTTTAI